MCVCVCVCVSIDYDWIGLHVCVCVWYSCFHTVGIALWSHAVIIITAPMVAWLVAFSIVLWSSSSQTASPAVRFSSSSPPRGWPPSLAAGAGSAWLWPHHVPAGGYLRVCIMEGHHTGMLTTASHKVHCISWISTIVFNHSCYCQLFRTACSIHNHTCSCYKQIITQTLLVCT